jgi:hypothetical protein
MDLDNFSNVLHHVFINHQNQIMGLVRVFISSVRLVPNWFIRPPAETSIFRTNSVLHHVLVEYLPSVRNNSKYLLLGTRWLTCSSELAIFSFNVSCTHVLQKKNIYSTQALPTRTTHGRSTCPALQWDAPLSSLLIQRFEVKRTCNLQF